YLAIILKTLPGVNRNSSTAAQLSQVEAIISLEPVKYTDSMEEPSSMPKPTAHLRPSRSMPASMPEKASRLIWYSAAILARLSMSPVTTPTDAPSEAPPTNANSRIKYLDRICSADNP